MIKRYRLIKDLPEFKIGGIFERGNDGSLWTLDQSSECRGWMMVYGAKTLDKHPNIMKEWFEEIKPDEPLIQDPKIRKAVRAWADANGIEKVQYLYDGNILCFEDNEIDFKYLEHLPLDLNEYYTIKELCGGE